MASLTGASLTMPVFTQRVALGTYQIVVQIKNIGLPGFDSLAIPDGESGA